MEEVFGLRKQVDMREKVAILILFFEKPVQTLDCIKSFLNSECKIYLLNNGSSESATNKIEEFISGKNQVHYIKSESNLGPAGGRNVLIKASTEEWIFLIDSDITIYPDRWFNIFKSYVETYGHTDIFLPRLFNKHENTFVKHPVFKLEAGKVKLEEQVNSELNYFPSGASIVSRKVLNPDNLFDSDLHGFEDYEFAIRSLILKKKYNIKQIQEIILNHDHQFAKRKDDKKAIKERYNFEKLTASFKYIEKKFNINFEHDWEWWNKKQIYEMAEKNFLKELKKKIVRFKNRFFHL